MEDKLYDLWAKGNPDFETRFDLLLRQYCDYGKGTNQFTESKAKILGAGYEMYIIAFFIGLYADRTKPLNPDPMKRKVLGQPIMYWGNIENRKLRKAYPELRTYIFMALLARTDIDFIALDKGELQVQRVVADLKKKMEEYANYGFDYIHEKLEEDSAWLSRNSSLLDTFLSFTDDASEKENDDEPDEI
ncbi:MAG: glycoside hydrolase family 15 [Phocaeicola plebeius]|nr:glycoside hydrolase family 15 [Phocaeicola plebeius]